MQVMSYNIKFYQPFEQEEWANIGICEPSQGINLENEVQSLCCPCDFFQQ